MVSSILDSIFMIFREKWWGMMHEVSLHLIDSATLVTTPPTGLRFGFVCQELKGVKKPRVKIRYHFFGKNHENRIGNGYWIELENAV